MESPEGAVSTEGLGVKSAHTNEYLDSCSCLLQAIHQITQLKEKGLKGQGII